MRSPPLVVVVAIVLLIAERASGTVRAISRDTVRRVESRRRRAGRCVRCEEAQGMCPNADAGRMRANERSRGREKKKGVGGNGQLSRVVSWRHDFFREVEIAHGAMNVKQSLGKREERLVSSFGGRGQCQG